ncbi:MAG: SMP-30/gluconolactonase/LRE family protein [Paracoccaceae bacterium]
MTTENDPRRPRLGRRAFLAAAGGMAGAAALAPAALAQRYGPDAAPVRYPEPDVVVLDDRFTAKLGNAAIERLHTGTRWAEGPAWNGVGRYLVWSDIPSDTQLRWTEEDGHVSMRFRSPSGHSNGNTFDREGRQISCEHDARRVVRYEYDGSTTVLAESFEGEGFNAPNDAVVHPEDGAIWFTDPGYGGLMDYEGNRLDTGSPQPVRKEAVYRIDAQSGEIARVTDAPYKPNGLCFSPDYSTLYVADTGVSHYDAATSQIWAFDVDGTSLRNERAFASMTLDGRTGFADGIRADEAGNVWSSAGWAGEGYDGVHVFAPNGDRIAQILLPEICSNVCFGGQGRNRLFMTASQSLYAVYVEARGAHFC